MKTLLATAMALLILLAQPFPGLAQEPENEPPSPDFAHALELLESGVMEPGYIPPPVSIKARQGVPEGVQALRAELPTRFDLRETGRVTAIRNQGSCGSCWAFATMASIESGLMPGEAWDFSEDNLKNNAGFDLAPCAGGNHMMSTAYLARGAGPVSESDDPYEVGSTTSQTFPARKWIRKMVYLPGRTGSLDNEFLKQAVMNHGGVYTSHYTSQSASHYNSSTAAHYYPGTTRANHAVVIVGWDDNYPASNFPSPPPGNGAFIIKNSWGANFGDRGYFYVSYYDSQLGKDGSAYSADFGQAGAYSRIYQYDTLGWTSTSGGGSNPSYASIYTAEGSAEQEIFAVSTYAPAQDTSYTVRIYKNPSGGPVNSSGPVAEVSGGTADAGYFTVDLPSPVRVAPGERFSVVFTVSSSTGTSYLIPMESAMSGYSSKATAASGRSYTSSNGTSWSDVGAQGRDVCIKAFARAPGGPSPDPDPQPEPEPEPEPEPDPDSDNDGLDDAWERTHFGDLSQSGGGDYDRDGLSNQKEYELGTNPAQADTDGDGMPDGWEVTHGLNPKANDASADPDGDGLSNLEEYRGGTNPNEADSDSGGDDSGDDDSNDGSAPAASAGQDMLVGESQTVQMEGTAQGANGSAVSVTWTQIGGPAVSLSGSGTARPSFTAPQVGPDGALLTFRLTASSGGQSVADTCVVKVMDTDTPRAAAGQDQFVGSGERTTLDGSRSSHPSGSDVAFAWEQTGGPSVRLDDASAATPSFTAPAGPATLVFRLRVSEPGSSHETRDECLVFVGRDGTPPQAEAGTLKSVQPATRVTLDGSASKAGAGASIASFVWAQVAGQTVELHDADTDKPYFTAPDFGGWGGALTFELCVSDDQGLTNCDQTVVNVLGSLNPNAPKARAGADERVDNLTEHQADATASSDDQAEDLSFEWLQTAGSPVGLDDPASASPVFDLRDAQGEQDLVFRLRVRDKAGLIGEDELRLVLGEAEEPIDDGSADDDDGAGGADWEPADGGSGGGGGCTMSTRTGFGLEWLLLAVGVLALRLRAGRKGGRS